MKIEVSNGEILDKYTILQIKMDMIEDDSKLENIRREFEVLTPKVDSIFSSCKNQDDLESLYGDLLVVNGKLWDIEDRIRDCERAGDFSDTFVQLARSVYFTNDERALVKKKINTLTTSSLVEEKSYSDYKRKDQ